MTLSSTSSSNLVFLSVLTLSQVLFFGISIFFELLCIILYAIYFPKLSIVEYYCSKAAPEGLKTVSADLTVDGIQDEISQQVMYTLVLIAVFNVSDLISRSYSPPQIPEVGIKKVLTRSNSF
ncbi:transmembrane protein, putative [Medicago truncatula]|uniref:Transmembrane protein, putative n=1 Tax=Medicago truncatula TaxID=3880 RepID=A0A072V3B0_MEDTR|nr:transmembrane protein, putative [Medicago truncatula]